MNLALSACHRVMFSLFAECLQDAVFYHSFNTLKLCSCGTSRYVLQFYRYKCSRHQWKCSTNCTIQDSFYVTFLYFAYMLVIILSVEFCILWNWEFTLLWMLCITFAAVELLLYIFCASLFNAYFITTWSVFSAFEALCGSCLAQGCLQDFCLGEMATKYVPFQMLNK